MSSKEDELHKLNEIRLRLKRALNSNADPAQKRHIQEQLDNNERSIEALKAEIDNPSHDLRISRQLTLPEMQYLGAFVRSKQPAADIYSDVSIVEQSPRTRKKLTDAAVSFIELHHALHPVISHSFGTGKSEAIIVDTFPDLLGFIQEHRRIALIGDPGAGKTMTMTKLAHHFGSRALEQGHGPLPVFVDLSVRGHSLEQLIARSARAIDIGSYAPTELVVFFDGLNEASREIVDSLVVWLATNPERPSIVSCRKLDYVDRRLPLRRVDLLPLDVLQIYNLIAKVFQQPRDVDTLFWALAGPDARAAWRWYRTSSDHEFRSFHNFWEGDIGHAWAYEVEKHKIAELQAAAREKKYSGVLDIVTNPFLLFIAIAIFDQNEAPPESRGKLFEEFASLMLARGGWVEKDPATEGAVKTKSEAAGVLGEMAHEMILEEKGTGVTEAWIRDFVVRGHPSCDADSFIRSLAQSGIMEWRGDQPSVVKFRHQLLQEYFASIHVKKLVDDGALASQFWPADSWWEHSPWDEVALLLSDIEPDPERVVRWLAPTNPSLAHRCATGRGVEISDELLAIVLDEGNKAGRNCPVAKAEWGRRLAASGDKRRGVGVLENGMPDIEWILVPPGPFRMGGGGPLLRELGLFVPEHQLDIAYPFLVAKYPVTCAQFQRFLDDGYHRDEFWTGRGLDWRGAQARPRLWDDPKSNIANHPVVGVTWFEAMAFAAWLDAAGRAANWKHRALGKHWGVSLPLEAEWEKAARYPDGREFPWGKEYETGAANIDETFQGTVCGPYSLRRTTAVGLYDQGASALGIYDMCGNVWEWCLSRWDVEYRYPEEVSPEGNVHRGVRGGSWYNSVAFAVSSAHDCHDSDLGVNDVGFRLVIRPADALANEADTCQP